MPAPKPQDILTAKL